MESEWVVPLQPWLPPQPLPPPCILAISTHHHIPSPTCFQSFIFWPVCLLLNLLDCTDSLWSLISYQNCLDFGRKVKIPLPLLWACFSGKESSCQCRSHRRFRLAGSNPGLGRSPGVGNGNPLHYACWDPIIPWTEESGGPQSMGSQRVRHDWAWWLRSLLCLFCLHQLKQIFYF